MNEFSLSDLAAVTGGGNGGFAAQINSNIDNKFAAMQLADEQRYSRQLETRVNQLETQNIVGTATAGVVRYPMSTTYSSGNNPFCNCGCGCN